MWARGSERGKEKERERESAREKENRDRDRVCAKKYVLGDVLGHFPRTLLGAFGAYPAHCARTPRAAQTWPSICLYLSPKMLVQDSARTTQNATQFRDELGTGKINLFDKQ